MKVELTETQYDLVLQSLYFTKSAFAKTSYPTYEMKQKKLDSVQEVISMLREGKKERDK